MLTFTLLLIISGMIVYLSRKLLGAGLNQEEGLLREAEREYTLLADEEEKVKKQNSLLHQALTETIALYDLTREISKTLDEQKLFLVFSRHLSGLAKAGKCLLLAADCDLSAYQGYTIIPLEIESKAVGYLAAESIKEQNRQAFDILANQFILGIKRAYLYRKIQEMAITDALTGAFTRSYYMERFGEELARSQRFHYKFSYLMVDIDGFKGFNDGYGHLVGDAILREVSAMIKEKIRQIDSLGRHGGDEFLVILPETDTQGAQFAAERIRQAIESKMVKAYDEELKVTVSIGVATFPEHGQENSVLIDNADKALYQAKQEGRNRVAVFHA